MKAKMYPLLERCIEDGVALGYARAHKHTDNPDESHMIASLEQAIMNVIDDAFTFDDFEEQPQ